MPPGRGVPVEIGGVERHLRYTMSAIRRIEERFNVDLVRGGELSGLSFDDVMWLIGLGLQHEQPPAPRWWERILGRLGLRRVAEPLTQEALESMMAIDELDRLADALNAAFGARSSAAEKKSTAS